MKKSKMFLGVLICISFLFTGSAYAADVAINSTNFPDNNFREYVKQFDTSGNGLLSDDERKAVKYIDVNRSNISNFKGIEHFTELLELRCNENPLGTLSLTQNKYLVLLECEGCLLTKLDVTKCTELRYLTCSNNQLTSLNVTKNTVLESIACGGNQLTSLNVTKNTKLTDLHAWDNNFAKIDVTKNTELIFLNVDGANITTLNVTKNTKLQTLYCMGNQLKKLDVTKNTELVDLRCNGNLFTSLNVKSNPRLKILHCGGMELKSLNVTQNNELQELDCRWSQITSLNLLSNWELRFLNCSHNQLTKLDLSNNWYLRELDCSGNKITKLTFGACDNLRYLYCYENQLKTLDVSNAPWNLQIIECYANKLTSLKIGNAGELRTLDCEDNNLSKIDISGCPALRRIFTDDDVAFIEEVIEGNLNDAGTVGEEYSSTINVKGGEWPYTWKRLSGKLPTGLKLTYEDDRATISGKPTQANEYTFYLQVTDRKGLTAKKKFMIKISEAATNTTAKSKNTVKEKDPATKKSTGSATSTTENLNASPKKEVDKDKSDSSFSVENFFITINPEAGEVVENNSSTKTALLEVIGENKLWQGEDKDEDLIKVNANLPVSFKIGTWVNPNGSEVKTKIPSKDIEVLIDEKVFEDVKVSDEGEFTIPAEIVVDDFKIQARAKEFETIELFISVE